MKYIIGIDIGTSLTKTILINEHGKIIGDSSYEYSIDTPRETWAEQHPDTWWQAVVFTIKQILARTKVNPRNIAVIGLSGQMHSSVFLDKNMNIIRPAIIWADQRSKKEARDINRIIKEAGLYTNIGNCVYPGFMCATLQWLKKNEPEVYKMIAQVVLPKDYIRYKLTGRLMTDVTDGSSTLLFNTRKRRWSGELLELLGFPEKMFPEVVESPTIIGKISQQAAGITGLAEGIQVIAGGGDQSMTALGNGVIEEDTLLVTIGTGGQLFVPTDKFIVDPAMRIHSFCHALSDKWHLMGATLSAGLCLKWFKENIIRQDISYQLLSQEAAKIEPVHNDLFFLPYIIGERKPDANSLAAGIFYGLSLQHHRAHLVRAIMEGVSFSLKEYFTILLRLKPKINTLIISGGAVQSQLWCQIQADIFNMDLKVNSSPYQASLGAALLAAVSIGIYPNIEEACKKVIVYGKVIKPRPDNVIRYEKAYQHFKSLINDNRPVIN